MGACNIPMSNVRLRTRMHLYQFVTGSILGAVLTPTAWSAEKPEASEQGESTRQEEASKKQPGSDSASKERPSKKATAKEKPSLDTEQEGERGRFTGIDAHSLTYPLVYTGRMLSQYDLAATHLIRARRSAVTAYIRKETGQGQVKANTTSPVRSTIESSSFGLTPAFRVFHGVRLGVGYDAETRSDRVRMTSSNGSSISGKRGWDFSTVTGYAATPVLRRWVLGLKYGSSKLSLHNDLGSGARGRLSFTDLRPSVAWMAKRYEVHMEFVPQIAVRHGGAAYVRAPTWNIAYQREWAENLLVIADASYALRSAVREGENNAIRLRGGAATARSHLPVLGGLIGIAPAHYENGEGATLDNAQRFEVAAFADFRPDQHTHYAVIVDAALIEDAKAKGQTLGYQATFARHF